MEPNKHYALVLDDDPSIGKMIGRITGFAISGYQSLEGLLPEIGNLNPTAAFIDIHLGASQSGLEIIPTLRSKWPHMPVIVLTSDSADDAIEGALSAGADDFLRKPIQASELKARLNARLEEKANLIQKQMTRFGDLSISPAHQRLSAGGKTVYLSPTALNLLCSLIEMKALTVSRDLLKRKVWGRLTLTDNALDRKVYEVRKALEELGSNVVIHNIYGEGYQISNNGEPSPPQAAKVKSEIPKTVSTRHTRQNLSILLVEDQDPDAILVREALRKGLTTVGYELSRTKTLSDAITLSEKGGFDIALLDLSLPDCQGVQTFKKFSQHFGELPIIILSGTADEKLALEAVSLGSQDFVPKDELHPLTLSKTIQYALARFRMAILEKSMLREKQVRSEALSDLKTMFLANMSHEIRTPMNAVIAMASVLSESKLTTEQMECVSTIRSSGQALLQVINEILDFSKFQSGKVELENTTFQVRKTVEEVIDLFSAEAESKGLDLLETVHAQVPVQINGDPSRLRQVLVNLIGNAIKFTTNGSVTVNVSLATVADKSSLRFEVKDTGIGITEEEGTRLFEVFHQANLSTTKKFGGTGLGLAISKSIVELMHGEIGFNSKPNHGTIFFFEIPLSSAESGVFPSRPDLSQHFAFVYSDRVDQGEFLCEQLRSRNIKTELIREQTGLIEQLSISKTQAKPHTLVIIAANSESNALELCEKLDSMPHKSILLWMLPKKATSPIWSHHNVIRVPYTQSRLYEKLAELLCENPTTPTLSERDTVKMKLSPIHLNHPILVAEDNQVNQRVVDRMLNSLGIRCDIVSNGLEAIKALENGSYSAVLMDCSMPEMDGWTATKELRRKGSKIPIIAMTANAFKEDRDRSLNCGMNAYLSKPITLEDLSRALTSTLKSMAIVTPENSAQSNGSLQIMNEERLFAANNTGECAADTKKFIAELKTLFLANAPSTFNEVIRLIDRGETEALKSQAHRLKGLAYNLSAERLSAVCAQIEELASHSQIKLAQEQKQRLTQEWQELMELMKKDLAA